MNTQYHVLDLMSIQPNLHHNELIFEHFLEPFYIFENVNHNIPVANVRILHELTNNSNCITNIRSCNKETDEFSHQPYIFLYLKNFTLVQN